MAQINISIDDVSPHPLSSTKVLDQCYRLIESFLDEGLPPITEDQLEGLYIKYQELYRELRLNHDGDKQ